jgi:hypothetical protein
MGVSNYPFLLKMYSGPGTVLFFTAQPQEYPPVFSEEYIHRELVWDFPDHQTTFHLFQIFTPPSMKAPRK